MGCQKQILGPQGPPGEIGKKGDKGDSGKEIKVVIYESTLVLSSLTAAKITLPSFTAILALYLLDVSTGRWEKLPLIISY